MTQPGDILQSTMSGLEAGLKVMHIATFEPACCEPDDEVGEVLTCSQLRDFDYIPVTEHGRYLGVLKRVDGLAGPARHHMRPLDDAMLVSAEEPLARFISILAESPYRLVVMGTRIQGIVTWSDVLKLPVRLLTFTLVTHLEMVMADVIRTAWPANEDWLSKLSAGRRNKVEEKARLLQRDKLDPSWLEFTDFCDKRDIIATDPRVSPQFTSELKRIETLRNELAHAGTYAESEHELITFVGTLNLLQEWINRLQGRLLELRERLT